MRKKYINNTVQVKHTIDIEQKGLAYRQQLCSCGNKAYFYKETKNGDYVNYCYHCNEKNKLTDDKWNSIKYYHLDCAHEECYEPTLTRLILNNNKIINLCQYHLDFDFNFHDREVRYKILYSFTTITPLSTQDTPLSTQETPSILKCVICGNETSNNNMYQSLIKGINSGCICYNHIV